MTVFTFNIFGALNTARVGMNAQQASLSVTGQNVANVNTEGYSRRSVILNSMPGPPTGGGGVWIGGIHRYTDQFASDRLLGEETLHGDAEQRSVILSHVAELFNDLHDTALGSSFDNFFGSLRQLESNPSDLTVRQEVLARTQEISSTFNRIAGELDQVGINIDNSLAASAAEVNVRTEAIATINKEITLSELKDGDASDLLDQRDRLILEIAEHVSIHAVTNDKNQMTVFMEGGIPLVEGIHQSKLQVLTSAAPGAARVEYIASNGQVQDITARVNSGAMGGALRVRDQMLPAYTAELDELAFDFATSVNAQHQAGFGLDSVGGRDLFTNIGAVAGAASQISLDAGMVGNAQAVAAAEDPLMVPGDNRNALALAALADQNLAAGNTITFNEDYSQLVGEVGVATRRAVDEVTLRDLSIKKISDLKDSATGVSLDEEMTNLIRFQRGYQASARVLGVIDQVIQTILNLGA